MSKFGKFIIGFDIFTALLNFATSIMHFVVGKPMNAMYQIIIGLLLLLLARLIYEGETM